MFEKAACYYCHILKFVPICYMTNKICDKDVNTHHFMIQFVPECYKSQECVTELILKILF